MEHCCCRCFDVGEANLFGQRARARPVTRGPSPVARGPSPVARIQGLRPHGVRPVARIQARRPWQVARGPHDQGLGFHTTSQGRAANRGMDEVCFGAWHRTRCSLGGKGMEHKSIWWNNDPRQGNNPEGKGPQGQGLDRARLG